MTVLLPEAVQAQGNISVKVVQTIADLTAPKLATEINAVSSVDVSCFLYSGGVGTSTTNRGESPRRLCTRDVYQQAGNKTYEVTDLQYVYSPQGAGSVDANKAKTALTEGSIVYLVVRKGLDAQTAPFAAAQKVEVWKVRLLEQNRTMTGDGEFDEFSITQGAIVIGKPVLDATVAA
jgi:hypothetical protein